MDLASFSCNKNGEKGRKRPSKDEDKLRYESKKNPSGLFIMRVYECDEVALDHMHV